MTNFDKVLHDLTQQFDGVVFAHGRYQGYKVTTHIAPIPDADEDDDEQWQHIIRVRLRIEGHSALKSRWSKEHETWKDAFKDFREMTEKCDFETYAPTLELKSTDSGSQEILEHLEALSE